MSPKEIQIIPSNQTPGEVIDISSDLETHCEDESKNKTIIEDDFSKLVNDIFSDDDVCIDQVIIKKAKYGDQNEIKVLDTTSDNNKGPDKETHERKKIDPIERDIQIKIDHVFSLVNEDKNDDIQGDYKRMAPLKCYCRRNLEH